MGERNDGGPAMPYSVHMEGFDRLSFPGMSLRDWFAGQAFGPLMAALESAGPTVGDINGPAMVVVRQVLAEQAYALADAMLAERSKP